MKVSSKSIGKKKTGKQIDPPGMHVRLEAAPDTEGRFLMALELLINAAERAELDLQVSSAEGNGSSKTP
jgi:hypothetical protein